MPIRHVVLDFDGTCTKVEDIAAAYVDACIAMFEREVEPDTRAVFEEKLREVEARSPVLAWEFAVPPAAMTHAAPSAPAYADPYIAVGEAVKLVLAARGIQKPVPDLHTPSNDAAEAPWRDETIEVLAEIARRDISIHFVSNSRSTKIAHRLDVLLAGEPALRSKIGVLGDAGKFVVRDAKNLPSTAFEEAFFAIPAAAPALVEGKRPIYLRRGGYYEALAKIWSSPKDAESTLVCGDIWELDLAMPAHLGAQVHLVERTGRHTTYDYEKKLVEGLGARATFGSLRSVLDRLAR